MFSVMARPTHKTTIEEAQQIMNAEAFSQFKSELARQGGLARAAKYSKKQMREWGKMGGRPRKKKETLDAKAETKQNN